MSPQRGRARRGVRRGPPRYGPHPYATPPDWLLPLLLIAAAVALALLDR